MSERRCGYGDGWPLIIPCELPEGHLGNHEWHHEAAASAGADPEPPPGVTHQAVELMKSGCPEDAAFYWATIIVKLRERAQGGPSLDVERLRSEIERSRSVGVLWEPSIDPKTERWYAEGYDRGLRDVLDILARFEAAEDAREGEVGER